jgi:hypothetical protein
LEAKKMGKIAQLGSGKDAIILLLRHSENDTETHITYGGKATLFAKRFFPNPTADFNALETITQLFSNQFALLTRVISNDMKDIFHRIKP